MLYVQSDLHLWFLKVTSTCLLGQKFAFLQKNNLCFHLCIARIFRFWGKFLENTLYFFIGTFFYALAHFFWRIYKMFKFKICIPLIIYFWLKLDIGEKFLFSTILLHVFFHFDRKFFQKRENVLSSMNRGKDFKRRYRIKETKKHRMK